jgi:diguanylate cyclase (GGDEF)-like protein
VSNIATDALAHPAILLLAASMPVALTWLLHRERQSAKTFWLPTALVSTLKDLLQHETLSQRFERRFLAVSEMSNDALFILDSVRDAGGDIIDFRFAYLNENAATLMSGTPQDMQGKLLGETSAVNRSHGFFDKYKRVVDTGESIEEEFSIDSPQVKATWIHFRVAKLEDGIAITASNISARKESEMKLAKFATFKQSIVDSSPFATMVTDLDGTITSINPAAERMLGYNGLELIDRENPLLFLDAKELGIRASALSEELGTRIAPGLTALAAKPQRGLVEDAEWTFLRKNGSTLDVQLTVSGLTTAEGEMIGLILVAYDITERKRMESYISHLAHHDALTGLPTRILLNDRLTVSLAAACRYHRKGAVIMVDLDGFKRVNDLLGHHVGDQLLVEIASFLQHSVRDSDTVARMGGDEFVILLEDVHSIRNAEALSEKILLGLRGPFVIGTHTLTSSASIGICTYPEGGSSVDAIMNNADTAMYQAKADGRNCYKSFTPDMAIASSRKRHLEVGLQRALALGEFEVVYQPQVSMRTGQATGVEALLRWRSPKLGLVMPSDFISLAEANGLIVPIGEWVLRTACREGKKLQQQTGKPLTIAVNISPRQFHEDSLPKVIREILQECDLDPETLELEITENILVSDSEKAMRVLEEIRALGVHVAIDDFGTGFSSMSYILRFPVDRLKIDQSFVRNMTRSSDSSAVTNAVIALASGLRIKVVAEGVETAAHRDLLFSRGCDEAQGYFYSKPLSVAGLLPVMRSLGTEGAPRAA